VVSVVSVVNGQCCLQTVSQMLQSRFSQRVSQTALRSIQFAALCAAIEIRSRQDKQLVTQTDRQTDSETDEQTNTLTDEACGKLTALNTAGRRTELLFSHNTQNVTKTS